MRLRDEYWVDAFKKVKSQYNLSNYIYWAIHKPCGHIFVFPIIVDKRGHNPPPMLTVEDPSIIEEFKRSFSEVSLNFFQYFVSDQLNIPSQHIEMHILPEGEGNFWGQL